MVQTKWEVGVTENLVVASNQDHFFCACEQATHNCTMTLSFMASSNKIMRSYESVWHGYVIWVQDEFL